MKEFSLIDILCKKWNVWGKQEYLRAGGCPWLNLLLIGITEGCPREKTFELNRSKLNERQVGRAVCADGITWAEEWRHETTWHAWVMGAGCNYYSKVWGKRRGKRWGQRGRFGCMRERKPGFGVKEYRFYPEGSHWRILSRLDFHLN